MPTLSRRRLLAGTVAVTCFGWSGRAPAEPATAAAPALAPDGFRILRARPGSALLRGADAAPTAIWGFDGTVPGPLLRARGGEEVKVRVVNELPEATATHWHGIRL